ncbi:SseB family protein [Streptomyces sp. NPDC059816]|uniref:SseB family protein n=1 Tax=Streptomyces sp. NPDC059816 TaxID=3346960 RepID=UPI00364915F1
MPAALAGAPTSVSSETARVAVLERIAGFRESLVLVPLDGDGDPLTLAFGGLAWICAFTDEEALGRFATARGEETRDWPYRRTYGFWLLDEVAGAAGFPCGVALDAAGPDGWVLPPVRGIVPDRAALDAAHPDPPPAHDRTRTTEGHSHDRPR